MYSRMLRLLLIGLVLAVGPATGCGMLPPLTVEKHPGDFGAVKVWGWEARRRIEVLQQSVHRHPEGMLVLTVRWRNTASKPYKTQIRTAFFDEEGMLEKGACAWHLHRFRAGEEVIEWHSQTREATRYLIEVRGRGGWPF